MPESVWILLKHQSTYGADGETTTVLRVFATYDGLAARIDSIAARNPQYEMQVLASNDDRPWMWRIGPEEDQGFFGDRAVRLSAVEKPVIS